jgi:hypothetical protein
MTDIVFSGGLQEVLTICGGGALGALVKDSLLDGYFQLPYVKDKKLFLGFIGGALVGAFVGMVIDGSFLTAVLGGYTGVGVIQHLLPADTKAVKKQKKLQKE